MSSETNHNTNEDNTTGTTSNTTNTKTIKITQPFAQATNKSISIELNSFNLRKGKRISRIFDATKRDSNSIRLFLGIIVTSKLVTKDATKVAGYFLNKDLITFPVDQVLNPPKKPVTVSVDSQNVVTDDSVIDKFIENNSFPTNFRAEVPNIEIDENGEFDLKVSIGIYRCYNDHQVNTIKKFFSADNELEKYVTQLKDEDKAKALNLFNTVKKELTTIPSAGVQTALQVLNHVPAIVNGIATLEHLAQHNIELISQTFLKFSYDHNKNAMIIVNPDLECRVLPESSNTVLRVASVEKETHFNKNRLFRKEFTASPVLKIVIGNQPPGSINFYNDFLYKDN